MVYILFADLDSAQLELRFVLYRIQIYVYKFMCGWMLEKTKCIFSCLQTNRQQLPCVNNYPCLICNMGSSEGWVGVWRALMRALRKIGGEPLIWNTFTHPGLELL